MRKRHTFFRVSRIPLTAALTASVLFCGAASIPVTASPADEEILTGGWDVYEASDVQLDEGERQIFEVATASLPGRTYTPAAVLATQVVAGENFAFLCSEKADTPKALPEWHVLTVYVDLQGNATVIGDQVMEPGDVRITIPEKAGHVTGGWTIRVPEDTAASAPEEAVPGELSDSEAQAAWERSWEYAVQTGDDEIRYEPIALLGSQVVAGNNYCMLARGESAEYGTQLYVITFYENLKGHAEITGSEVVDLLYYVGQSEEQAEDQPELG